MLATLNTPLAARARPILDWLPSAAAVQSLGPRDCRWPCGEVWHDDFRFCGEPRSRGAYCAAHHRLSRVGAPR